MTKAEEKIVKEVVEDFKRRASERKSFDLIWQINMNFLMGNQYCTVGYGGNLEEQDRQFFWQQREVFNHIAPIYDIRYAKLSKIKPDINIIPATNDERDKQSAKVSKKIIQSVRNRLEIDEKVNQAIKWSEVCGTVFYKVGWNYSAGQVLGQDENGLPIRSGEIDFSVVSPFEIYPDSSVCERIEDCQSIIHAKAYPAQQVKNIYGVNVKGQKVNTYSLDGVSCGVGGLGFDGTASKIVETTKEDSVIVIERYEKESEAYPFGRLTVVAGDVLVYDGELPFAVGTDGKRDFPFIKQTSIIEPGSFWGTSVIERLVPVQRAYNAVKNRKHEFINRLSLGVLSVEDGSVDLDNLEEEGLCPGKVLVYRQGAIEPKYLQGENLPTGIDEEEKFLIDEFNNISGVSDLLSANGLTNSMSGIAIELMIGQDETRLNSSVESIKHATKSIAQKILKLYKQYAKIPRLERIVGENGNIEMFYFTSSDISSDDIIVENQTDDLQSLAKRRDIVLQLLDKGVFNDENGNLSNKMKTKIVEMLGMGTWENAQDVNELHIKKAGKENLKLLNNIEVYVSEIDNHSLHINEHIAFMLGQDFENVSQADKNAEQRFLNHINEHKKMGV
ncbi:MAG: hypothetical protein E7379_03035 [Clostridiales bacterium]|nr:hypothetical protein [Clostridiales bacterium]